MNRILQTNSNHARHAQNLLLQCMDEMDMSLAIVAEPYRVPPGSPNWIGSSDGSVAIVTRRTKAPIPCTRVGEGAGYVIVRWGEVHIIGVYISPNIRISAVEDKLDEISRRIRALGPAPIIIGRDFNAHSVTWGGRRNDARGSLVIDWTAAEGLICLNRGQDSTCIHPRGESVIDLTWASPSAARMVRSWRVMTEAETMSDHTYISMEICSDGTRWERARNATSKRWSLKQLDEDMLVAALLANTWSEPQEDDDPIEDRWRKMKEMLTSSCTAAMPVQRPNSRRAT